MKKALMVLAAALLIVPSVAGASYYYPSYYSEKNYYPSPSHYSGWCYWNCGMDYGYGGSNSYRPYGDDGLVYGGYGGYGGGYGGYGGSKVSNYISPTVTVYGPTWGWGW